MFIGVICSILLFFGFIDFLLRLINRFAMGLFMIVELARFLIDVLISNYLQARRPKLPLTAISNEVFVYKPSKSLTPAGHPYSTADDDPQKFFISGAPKRTLTLSLNLQ